jgi:hypothetical protein
MTGYSGGGQSMKVVGRSGLEFIVLEVQCMFSMLQSSFFLLEFFTFIGATREA